MNKFFVALVFILVIFLLGGFYVLDTLNNPGKSVLSATQKNKALIALLGRSPHVSETQTPITWNQHKSSYLQFSYPSWAKIYSEDNENAIKKGDSLDVFAFTLLDERVTGVVNVNAFSGTLSEYPGVSVRLLQKDIYTPTVASDSALQQSFGLTQDKDSGQASIGFTKQDDKIEKTLFFLKNKKVISVAVTGYSQDSVDRLFTPLVVSLKIF